MPLADSSMKLRALGLSRRILVAAPSYLAARGVPALPDDLTGHEGIQMTNIAGSDTLVPEWARRRAARRAFRRTLLRRPRACGP
jgi:hypothetical protein